MGDSLGERIYDVRLALGDGRRKALPMREFADVLSQAAGRTPPYNSSFISRWENNQSEPTLNELRLIASVDPRRRGEAWLAFGATAEPVTVSPEDAERARLHGLATRALSASNAVRAAKTAAAVTRPPRRKAE